MIRPAIQVAVLSAGAVAALSLGASRSASPRVLAPVPLVDVRAAAPRTLQTAVFAGGCFWGVEAVYEHVKGVTEVVSGYAGGSKRTAEYETVSSGTTGHAEAVKITFDPAEVSYGTLLEVFFSVVHDPTQLNRQGPDVGPQYRSAIFYADEEQARVARAYIEQLKQAKTFAAPIVTQVAKLDGFFAAEAYHQDFAARNPTYPYIVYHDRPKVENLKKVFPKLYRDVAADR
jgi:peptide-methionine (S)-S-oxide reductase